MNHICYNTFENDYNPIVYTIFVNDYIIKGEIIMATEQEMLDKFKENNDVVEIDSSKKIKVGIIGTGWIAAAHMKSLVKMPDVEVVAAADLVPGKAEKFMADYPECTNVKFYKDHKDLIDNADVDAVNICTYNATHAECAVYALDHGVHVMLEKPLCVTLEEGIEIMKAERRSGKVLSIGFQPRFDEDMKNIKKIVDSGVLGDIYYIQTGGGRRRGIPTPYGTTFIEKETGGIGALGDIGCYSLDLVLNAIGYPKPLTVTGYKSDFFGKDPNYYPAHPEYASKFGVDDFAAAFIRMEGGLVIDFRISWAMNMDTSGDTLILGTKGGLKVPSTECWNGTFKTPLKLYQEIGGNQVETEIPLKKTPEPLFDRKIRSFLDAIKNGTPSPVPIDQIIINQAIIDGIVKSSELGREVEITIPEL